jgi:hypothetical protein
MRPIERLDHQAVVLDPQLLVTNLLQHCLEAARHAMATSHPELGDDDAADLDEDAFLALTVMAQISSLSDLLRRYRVVTQGYWTGTNQLRLKL